MSVSFNQVQGVHGWTLNNLQPDAEGWVRVQLGRFGTRDASGDFVERLSDEVLADLNERSTSPRTLFGESTPVSRRNWRDAHDYLRIDLNGVSHQIKDIEAIIEEVDNVGIQNIYGKIRAIGPNRKFLDLLLATPDVILRFSYRREAFVVRADDNGVRLIVRCIITFDLHP